MAKNRRDRRIPNLGQIELAEEVQLAWTEALRVIEEYRATQTAPAGAEITCSPEGDTKIKFHPLPDEPIEKRMTATITFFVPTSGRALRDKEGTEIPRVTDRRGGVLSFGAWTDSHSCYLKLRRLHHWDLRQDSQSELDQKLESELERILQSDLR